MTGATQVCAKCRQYTALREKAKQEGDYDRAGDYETLRRRHPSHAQPGETARWGVPA
jgi:hypothetical protein